MVVISRKMRMYEMSLGDALETFKHLRGEDKKETIEFIKWLYNSGFSINDFTPECTDWNK